MRRALVTILITFAMATIALGQAGGGKNAAIEKELSDLSLKTYDALVKRDTKFIDGVWAAEYKRINPNGTIVDKKQRMDAMNNPANELESLSHDDVEIRVFGDTAVQTSRVTAKLKNQPEPNRVRVTNVWVKRDNRWQIVASHASIIESAPAQAQAASPAARPQSAAVKVDPKIYDAYVGQYEMSMFILTISREGDKLFGQPTNDSKEELIPESETTFNVTNVNATITFVKDDKGQVTHLVAKLPNGQELQGKKIK